VSSRLQRKIRKRLDQLYDDIVAEGFNENEVEDIVNGVEDDILDQLDELEAAEE
jgi:hypothetical protein